jgi:hypothetical protein
VVEHSKALFTDFVNINEKVWTERLPFKVALRILVAREDYVLSSGTFLSENTDSLTLNSRNFS